MAVFGDPSPRDAPYYAAALRECESGVRLDGLWAIAVVRAAGNDAKVKPIYLDLLAKVLKDAERHLQATRVAALAGEIQWFYIDQSGREVGPCNGFAMRKLANKLPASTLVCGPNLPNWTPLLHVRSRVL